MKKYIFSLLISTVVLFSWSYSSQAQSLPESKSPVFMGIPSINQEFPLLPRPEDTNPEFGVPHQNGVAFWRINGYAVDISSHCTETPGMYFHQITNGDLLSVRFSNGDTNNFIVYEVKKIYYQNINDPLDSIWIDDAGNEFTPQEFLQYSMLRKENIVLHSSLCRQSISLGQVFIFAKVSP